MTSGDIPSGRESDAKNLNIESTTGPLANDSAQSLIQTQSSTTGPADTTETIVKELPARPGEPAAADSVGERLRADEGARGGEGRWLQGARRVESALRWLTVYPIYPLIALLFCLSAFGGLGAELGVEHLFWHEVWWYQLGVGFFVGLLFAVLLLVEYLINRPTLVDRWLENGRSLFPSENRQVQALGRFILWGMVAGLLVVYFGKAVAVCRIEPETEVDDSRLTGWYGYLSSRNWLGPFLGGYLLAMLGSGILHRIDERWWRFWSANRARPLRERLLDLGNNFVPRQLSRQAIPAEEHVLHGIGLYIAIVAVLVVLQLVLYSFVMDAFWPGGSVTTPVSLAAALLIVFALLYGVVAFYLHLQRLIMVGGIGLLVCCNSTAIFHGNNYKIRFPGLTYDREHRTVLWAEGVKSNPDYYAQNVLPATEKYAQQCLIPSDVPIREIHDRWQATHPGQKPKLILIATSGGGIRAAVWTGAVLEELVARMPGSLEKMEAGFRDHLRMITGASGGMVAAALFTADFPDSNEVIQPEEVKRRQAAYVDVLADESLNRTAQSLVLRDMIRNTFTPPGVETGWDRGQTLEWKWGLNAEKFLKNANDPHGKGRNPFEKTFATLRGDRAAGTGEWGGRRPSLVLAPMMIEDSRRLLISNLRLDDLTISNKTEGPQFVSAVEFHRLFPDADRAAIRHENGTQWDGATSHSFRVATAARMSATFPVISPAVSIPTDPPRRIVDAGYYDNYGMNLAALWVWKHREVLRKYTSGVALIEIRAFPLHQAGRRFAATDPQTGEPVARAGSGDLFTDAAASVSAPLEAVFTARGNVTYYRNSEWVNVLNDTFADNRNPDGSVFFYNGWFELTRPASLNWYLTSDEKQVIQKAVKTKQLESQFVALKEWFGTGGTIGVPPIPVAGP